MENEILALTHVSLTQNKRQVLREVSLKIFAGDILGLVNVDYQGLSALQNLLVFNTPLEDGKVFFLGEEVSGKQKYVRRKNKISIIESSSHLIPTLSISDNFFFIKERSPFLVQQKKQLNQLKRIFKAYGLNLTGRETPAELSQFERCKFELVKLCETGYRLIIIKNLSSFLSESETEAINTIIKKVALEKGIAFLYMSTHPSNFFSVCNKIAVMQNGSILYKKDIQSFTYDMLEKIQKEPLSAFISAEEKRTDFSDTEIARISKDGAFDISIKKGEFLALLDLENRITEEISWALLNHKSRGISVIIKNQDAFKNPSLYSYIPENPRKSAFFPHLTYADNLVIKKCLTSPRFWLPGKFLASVKKEYKDKLGVILEKQDLIDATQEELYNLIYQKVLLERPEVLFINHPFDELDMMQRVWCFDLIRKIQNTGCTVVIFDIRATEFLKLTDRVLVIQGEGMTQSIDAENFDEFPLLK